MLARFICAFQLGDDKVYNVGSHISVLGVLELNTPGKFFADQVLNQGLKGPRGKDPLYMFLSEDGALKSYTFTQSLDRWTNRVMNLKEEDFMAGHHKAPLVKQCLENMHELILQSIAQMKTTTKLIAATAGTIMLKEASHAQLVLPEPEDHRS